MIDGGVEFSRRSMFCFFGRSVLALTSAIIAWPILGSGVERDDSEQFLAFSRVLTGRKELDKSLASVYLQEIKREFSYRERQAFARFWVQNHGQGKKIARLLQHQQDGRIARKIVSLWYTGQLSAQSSASQGQRAMAYQQGLMWSALAILPPGLPKGLSAWQNPLAAREVKGRGYAGLV